MFRIRIRIDFAILDPDLVAMNDIFVNIVRQLHLHVVF